MTVGAVSTGRLAINRFKAAKSLDHGAVDDFLNGVEVPLVEGPYCTFLWRGDADEAWVCQRVVGLPDRIPMRRGDGTHLWHLGLGLPGGPRGGDQVEMAG